MASTTNFSNWDFHKYRVQQELTGGQFVNAESTLIAAGPPSLSDVSNVQGDSVYPIALLEQRSKEQAH